MQLYIISQTTDWFYIVNIISPSACGSSCHYHGAGPPSLSRPPWQWLTGQTYSCSHCRLAENGTSCGCVRVPLLYHGWSGEGHHLCDLLPAQDFNKAFRNFAMNTIPWVKITFYIFAIKFYVIISFCLYLKSWDSLFRSSTKKKIILPCLNFR